MFTSLVIVKKVIRLIVLLSKKKNGIKCSTAFEMSTVAFGESTMNKTVVYEWYKCFKEGRENVEDDDHPSTSGRCFSTIDEIKTESLKERK